MPRETREQTSEVRWLQRFTIDRRGNKRHGRVNMPAPEVGGNIKQRVVRIAHDIGVERRVTLEGVVTQSALTEAVDGGNRHFVERCQCESHPTHSVLEVDTTRTYRLRSGVLC